MARTIAEIINSGIQPYQNANVVSRIAKYQGEDKKSEWINNYLTRGFRAVEAMLVKSSGKFCVGDEITIADCCLVPQVYSANRYTTNQNIKYKINLILDSCIILNRFNVDLVDFPNVTRVYAELEKVPAVQKAHAHRQPDTPDELRMA